MEDLIDIKETVYSFNDCIEEAKKYKNKKEWKENGQTYLCALNNDWVQNITERVGYSKNGRGRKWWFKIS